MTILLSLLRITATFLLIYIFPGVAVASAANDDAAAAEETDPKSVTILGMGGMGKAIAKCFLENGYEVHAWNRSPRSMDQVQMHATVPEAVAASSTTFVVINSEPKLQTVKDLLSQGSDESTSSFMEGKTIVNMVNHDPLRLKSSMP